MSPRARVWSGIQMLIGRQLAMPGRSLALPGRPKDEGKEV